LNRQMLFPTAGSAGHLSERDRASRCPTRKAAAGAGSRLPPVWDDHVTLTPGATALAVATDTLYAVRSRGRHGQVPGDHSPIVAGVVPACSLPVSYAAGHCGAAAASAIVAADKLQGAYSECACTPSPTVRHGQPHKGAGRTTWAPISKAMAAWEETGAIHQPSWHSLRAGFAQLQS
jgi:hypothetical protein